MKRLLLLLLFAAFVFAAQNTNDDFVKLSLDKATPARIARITQDVGIALNAGGRELLISAADISDDSVALEITENGKIICGGHDPNCIVGFDENPKITEMTGVVVIFLGVKKSFASMLMALPGLESGTCEKFGGEVDEEKALNVVFVPDGFGTDERRLFEESAENAAAAFRVTEPFASNIGKFNFYRAEFLLGSSFDWQDEKTQAEVAALVRGCRRTVTAVLSKGIEDIGYGFMLSGIALVPASLYAPGRDVATKRDGEAILAHEFGHVFAYLGDESLLNVGNLYKEADTPPFIGYPNIDEIGCPNWCSRGSAASPACAEYWRKLLECGRNANAECFDAVQKEFEGTGRKGLAMDFVLGCDFGTGCVSGTGCFPGALYDYLDRFTPVKKDACVMSGGQSFCPICTVALEKMLKRFG
ncbi:IgA Peptidase M64 [Candidatus Norongarragalina meridionalis]|nr:IgA Peptidase M64 [Candidatus Norongarragalina meridionalis]